MAFSVTISSTQIRQLQNLAPGWEEIWNQLWADLFEPLKSAAEKSVCWPCVHDRDDFVSEVMANYGARAARGTLFMSFDPEKGTALAFLTSADLLRKKAGTYLAQIASEQRPFPPGDHDPPGPSSGTAIEVVIKRVQQTLTNFKLNINKDTKITRPDRTSWPSALPAP